MNPHALLILILLGDPSGADVAKKMAEDFADRGGAQVHVVVGADAVKTLDERGIKVADLLGGPNIGEHLTAADHDLAVVHLDRHIAAGDVVVETRVWVDGRSDHHVAIAGNGSDPAPASESGVLQIIGARFPGGAPKVADANDEAHLTGLVGHEQWLEVLGLLAAVKDKTPRQYYYQVLAYSRLRQREPAVEALNAMRAAHPNHFLVAAAEELLPPPQADKPGEENHASTVDDGGNTLRDAPAKPAQAVPAKPTEAVPAKPADGAPMGAPPAGEPKLAPAKP